MKVLYKVVLIAMMTALCCAGTFIQIRMPAGDMVHLGNFVMILSALLLGGLAGGITGSLGMGIYDLIFYASKPSTILRTFILKFIIGFTVGYLFRLILKRRTTTKIFLTVFTVAITALSVVFLVLFIAGNKDGFGFDNGLSATHILVFNSKNYTFKVSLYIPIFLFLFAILLFVVLLFSKKLSKRKLAALVAISIAVYVNIIGEFGLRWLLEGLMVSDFKTSLVVATSKIPGSVITGFVSVILSILIYEPLYYALKHSTLLHDDTAYIEDEKEKVEKEDKENKKNIEALQ